MPYGGITTDFPAELGKTWVIVRLIASHAHIAYDDADIHEMSPECASARGLCAGCLGYGSGDPEFTPSAGRFSEGIPVPCAYCGGSGRTFMRLRSEGDFGHVDVLPHKVVLRAGRRLCAACGTHPSGEAHISG